MKRETEANLYRPLFILGFALLALKLWSFSEPIHIELNHEAMKDAYSGTMEEQMAACDKYVIEHQNEIAEQHHRDLDREREEQENVRRSEDHHEWCVRDFNERIAAGQSPEDIINQRAGN